jgi:hypothetical protein
MLISRWRLPEVIRMTEIGSSNPIGHGLPVAAVPHLSWWRRFNAWIDSSIDALIETLTRHLCRASRGYLCPPDMTSVMYPTDTRSPDSPLPNSGFKECCDEKLPRK